MATIKEMSLIKNSLYICCDNHSIPLFMNKSGVACVSRLTPLVRGIINSIFNTKAPSTVDWINSKMRTASFLRLAPPSTPIRDENGAFRKRSSNRGNFKTRAFRFRVNRKHFENGAFRKRRNHDNHVISLTEFSSSTNLKWPVIVAFSNYCRSVWTSNIWCVFRVKTPLSNFPA